MNKAIAIKPDYIHAYNNRGAVYLNIGDYDRALANLEKVVELDSAFYHVYVNLGNLYLNLGNTEKAHYYYQKTIDINPSKIDAYICLAQSYKREGNADGVKVEALETIKRYSEVISRSDQDYKPFIIRATAYKLIDDKKLMIGDCEKALQLLNKLIELHSDSPEFLIERARIYHMLEDDEAAKKDAAEALKHDARWIGARNLLNDLNVSNITQ